MKRILTKKCFSLLINQCFFFFLFVFFSLEEHERKIRSLNDEYQKQKQLADQRDDEWRYRLKTMDEHLQQTRQALEAASRLTEQIEQKELLIEQLKREGMLHTLTMFSISIIIYSLVCVFFWKTKMNQPTKPETKKSLQASEYYI